MKKANYRPYPNLAFCQLLPLLLLSLQLVWAFPARANRRMFSLTDGQKSVQLPIMLLDHLVVVAAVLNGNTPVNLILDTGTPAILLTDPKISRKLAASPGKEISFTGPGKGSKPIKSVILSNQTLSLPGIEGKELGLVATTEPLRFLKEIGDIPIQGILGYPFFTQFVVTIDYAHQLLTLTEPTHFKPDAQSQAFPFSLHQSKPVLQTTLTIDASELPGRLMVDTGAAYSLLLNQGSPAGKLILPRGPKTKLGISFGGEIYGRKATIPSLHLASLPLANTQALLPAAGEYNARGFTDRDGSIGGGLLHYFTVTINYQTQTLYLRQNPEAAPALQPILVQKKPGKKDLRKLPKLAGVEQKALFKTEK